MLIWTQIQSSIFNVVLVGMVYLVGYLILKLALPKLVSGAIDLQYSKKLEDHKHQLQQITLAERHNYQRLIRDFDLFTTKRHEIYPELYKAFLIADGQIRELRGGRYSRTLEDYDDEDIELYLKNRNAPGGQTKYFLELWREDRKQAIVEIKKYIRMLDIQQARTKLEEAKNYYYLSEIYLSDDVSKAVDEALDLLVKFLINVEYPEGSKYFREDRNKPIEDALSIIKEVMRRELAVGDYAEDKTTKSVPPSSE